MTAAIVALFVAQAAGPAFFETRLYPIFEAAQCRGCHSLNGVASATRLHFPEKDATPDAIRAFGLSLAPIRAQLLVKPTQRVAHTGGERIAPGSAEEEALKRWVEHLSSLSDRPAAAKVPPSASASGLRARRLTHSQYNNTVRDLLGDPSRPASRFPPEDFADGFRNQVRMQALPPLLVEAYSSAAERLAWNAFRSGDSNGLIPCRPSSANDLDCRDKFLQSFGLRAFRRPLQEAEFRRYAAAFSEQAGSAFLDGARAVVEAMLQSPKFMFHVEHSAHPDYAIAGRLSYFLWDTMPDTALFAAAARGELRNPASRERIARRMLESPHARTALDEFFGQWLRFDRVLNASKERRRFPEFSPDLAAAMVEETTQLLHHLVWTNANFMDFLRADYGFLSSDLAAIYGVPAPKTQFDLVRFPAGTPRAGLLGHASMLASTAGPVETSPTARGIFVREQLLCQHVPPPPPDVNTTLADPVEGRPMTRRQRIQEHASNPSCAACHKLMDPIGFGMESFDAIGRWREKEEIGKAALPVETKGEIAGLPASAFADSRELGRVLAASPVCQECVVKQVFRYAFGRVEGPADRETIRRYYAAFRDSGFRFRELLIAIARSPEFAGSDNMDTARR